MIDAHLVMNILNQMASHSFKQYGEEYPLLFSLSDYLQVALRYQTPSAVVLQQDAKLMEAHIKLLAAAHRAQASFSVEVAPESVRKLKPGCLMGVVRCLLESSSPQFGGDWHVHVMLGDDISVPDEVQVIVDVQNLTPGQSMDIAMAKSRLEQLCAGEDFLRSARWNQAQPHRLRLECFLGAC